MSASDNVSPLQQKEQLFVLSVSCVLIFLGCQLEITRYIHQLSVVLLFSLFALKSLDGMDNDNGSGHNSIYSEIDCSSVIFFSMENRQ